MSISVIEPRSPSGTHQRASPRSACQLRLAGLPRHIGTVITSRCGSIVEDYAIKIARDWNVPASGTGYVTRFRVRSQFTARYPIRQAGGKITSAKIANMAGARITSSSEATPTSPRGLRGTPTSLPPPSGAGVTGSRTARPAPAHLDLVALERSAGAGPTEALEAAAGIGGGSAFKRIGAALDQARQAGAEPWAGLAQLARETAISELADLADIAGMAGQEGAKVLDTLLSRAAAMRADALAADHAKAASRTTTMVVPVALLAAGFVLLLIFPDFYRVFIA